MIELDLVQGTDAWHKARAGIPTASHFAKIITAKTLKLSAQADEYENRLVAERMTGNPCEDFKGSRWIERGKEMEADAVAFYEMTTGLEVRYAGLLLNDARTFGCSPDGLIGTDRGLELKCPAPDTHVGYLLNERGAYDDYKPQVQASLFVSGFPFWEVMSFHPDLPPSLYTATPDNEYQDALAAALEQMEKNIQAKIAKIKGEK